MIEIVAAQPIVSGGRADFDNAGKHFDDRHVESAAAEVEDEKGFAFLPVHQAKGDGRRRRFVDQPTDGQSGQFARMARRAALAVVEIGWNGNDGFGRRLAGGGADIVAQARRTSADRSSAP
jgi:hypothetical protein